MTDLIDVSHDDIENNIMTVLYSTMDVKFTKISLFNKLIIDKYDMGKNNYIHPNFKLKYELVLRNLKSKYDDIVITDDNKIFCTFDKEKKETKNVEEYNSTEIISEINVNLSKYIIDNSIEKEFKYIDPFDGNTIYHDLVLSNNFDIIKKMIDDEIFEYFVFNKNNQTPLELSPNHLITNVIINGIYNKMLKDNKKYTNLLTRVEYLESQTEYINTIEECSIIDIFKIKLKKIFCDKKMYFNILFLCFIIYMFFL